MGEVVKIKVLKLFVFIAVFAITVQNSIAQCAMCKATVENSENSETFAAGLNAGILYLMSVPYILFMVIAFLWYRNSKKNKEKQEKIERRIKETISRS